MRGWSSWAGWLVMGALGIVVGCKGEALDEAVRAAADAGAPPAPTPIVDGVPDGAAPVATADAGAPAAAADGGAPAPDAAVAPPLVPTTMLAAAPEGTAQLAADARGVVGITGGNGVWALDAGAATPRLLVPGRATPEYTQLYGQLILAGDDIYWLDLVGSVLHHVRRDGGDEVLASNLVRPGSLAADDDRVYWSECTYEGRGGGVIRALPRGVAPGSAAVTLFTADLFSAIGSLAVSSDALYWTEFNSFATIYFGGLFSAPVAALMSGGGATGLDHAGASYGVAAIGGQIYFGAFHGTFEEATIVARLYEPGDLLYSLSILPFQVSLTAIAVVDDVLAVTGTQAEGQSKNLYAFPVDGAGPILVAQNLQTAAVTGPSGATFVDAAGNLVAIAPADLKAAALNRAP
jgi:hypothetical protein